MLAAAATLGLAANASAATINFTNDGGFNDVAQRRLLHDFMPSEMRPSDSGGDFALGAGAPPARESVAIPIRRAKLTPMKASGQAGKISVVVTLSLAWLVASSHCAIAAMTGGHAPAEHSCCSKNRPSDAPVSCAEKCCDGMAAPLAQADGLFPPLLVVVSLISDLPSTDPHRACLGSPSGLSPPGPCAEFFVEYVLGRSQQPVAPPVFVA